MARDLVVIGAPTSAASYAAGQEQAPAVLRAAGLLDRLAAGGRVVRDGGDGLVQVWTPDRRSPLAQNVESAALALVALKSQIGVALDDGADVLVLGGNCTVALAVMAALSGRRMDAGLLYVDRHFDLNTPATTTDGALDWMGIAHGLGLDGTVPEFTADLAPLPVLRPSQISYLGVDPAAATAGERSAAAALGLAWESSADLATEPAEAARRALDRLPGGVVAVHVDVDVLDFTDAPLAESTGGRNSGPSLAALTEALAVACGDPRFRVLSVGELNPDRSAGVPETIDRFIGALETVMG